MVRARTGGILVGSLLVVGACQGAPAPVVEKKVEVEKQVELVEPVKPVKAETEVEVEKKVEPEKPVEPPPVVDVAKPAGLAAEQFMFVFRGDVALAPGAEEGWGTGKVKFKKTKEGLEGRRDVDVAKLPEALRKLDGAAVTLYGARGKVCEGTLKGLSLYGLSERGDEEETEGELPSMPVLMAGLVDKKGSCAGALWARRSELAAPVVFTAGKAEAALIAKAREATAKLVAYAAMGTSYGDYARETDDKVTWEKFAAKQFRAAVWTEAGGRKLVVTEVGDPDNVRCEGNFSESLAAVFEVVGDELKVMTEAGPWQAQALFDANGDGAIEALLVPPGGLGGILVATTRGEGEALGELRFPSEGLGCGDEMDDEP